MLPIIEMMTSIKDIHESLTAQVEATGCQGINLQKVPSIVGFDAKHPALTAEAGVGGSTAVAFSESGNLQRDPQKLHENHEWESYFNH